MNNKENLLSRAIEETITGFWANETFDNEGIKEPVSHFSAAEQVIKSLIAKTEMDLAELAIQITKATSLTPDRLNIDDLVGSDTWPEYWHDLIQTILVVEASDRDPKIQPEVRRRFDSVYL